MYKSMWAPAFGETLACEVEFGNIHDPYAVAVRKPGIGESSFETVGHVPRKISALCHFFHKSWYYHFITSMITPYHVQRANYK